MGHFDVVLEVVFPEVHVFSVHKLREIQFLLELVLALGHEFVRGGDVNGLEELLGLLDDDALEVYFLCFDSALSLSGYSLGSVTID